MTFIDYIESLYQSLDIYRAVILVKDCASIPYISNELKNKYHNPVVINDTTIINYDYRLFITDNIDNLCKFTKNSYNLIIVV
jgi:hypothetical protein